MHPGLLLFGSFLIALFLGFPIAIALLISAFILLYGEVPLVLIPQKLYAGIDSFALLSIPLFMLAAEIMNSSGMSKRIFKFASVMVGHLPGGLALVNVLASMLFGGVSGSAAADVAGLGAMEIPAMEEDGYPTDFSAAITAASSIMGPIIPPSVAMIMYGTIAQKSISDLFMGGAIPGILLGLALMAICYYVGKKKKYGTVGKRPSFRQVLQAFRENIWGLLFPLFIIGGILSGIFTATEAAAAAVLYALVIGAFVYKELHWRDLPRIFYETIISSGAVAIVISTAAAIRWVVLKYHIADALVDSIFTITDNTFLILFMLNIFLLVLGAFIETSAALYIFVPLTLPLVMNLGIDPVHYGVVVVFNLCLGMLTPPYGLSLYIASDIAGLSMEKTVKAIVPFFLVGFAVLMLITYIPQLVLFLPSLF